MINNILKKIEKANEVQNVELEKHEVELGLMQDVKSNVSKFEKAWQQCQSALSQIDAKKHEYVSSMIEAHKILRKQIDILLPIKADLKTLETQAKELGLNINDSKEFQNAVSVTNELSHQRLEKIIFSIFDAQKSLKNIEK